jgi:hypothetical protein
MLCKNQSKQQQLSLSLYELSIRTYTVEPLITDTLINGHLQ